MKKEEFGKIRNLLLQEKLNPTNSYLYYYEKMNLGFDILNYLYSEGYESERIKYNILKNESIKSKAEKVIDLTSVVVPILSTLIGLNKEELQNANSKISNNNLFQYKDYEENLSYDNSDEIIEVAREMSKLVKFNPSKSGPFPNMLEINKTDNKNRPFDYVAKIRNALEHAEYYQPKGNINVVNLTNTENGNVIFEGRLLLWLFRYFVEDYFGHGLGVAPVMETYEYDPIDQFNDKESLVHFLKTFAFVIYKFTDIPDDLKFKGNRGLFSELNSSFDISGAEVKSFKDNLEELSKKGVKFEWDVLNFKDEEINGIMNFINNNYKDNLYNNKKVFEEILNLIKFICAPNREMANCYNNILRYIDFKKHYLLQNDIPEKKLFDEQEADENVKYAFKTSIALLRVNIVNYLLESSELEIPSLKDLEINDIKISSRKELIQRMKKCMNEGIDFEEAFNYVILNTIRNAMAHGNERIKIILDDEIYVSFDDEYNEKHFKVVLSLNNLNKIYSNNIFKPQNVKVEQKEKQLTKTI